MGDMDDFSTYQIEDECESPLEEKKLAAM